MIPYGTLLNIIAVLFGGAVGLFFKGIIRPNLNKKFFFLIGVFTIGLGFFMTVKSTDYFLLLISIIFGTILGYEMKLSVKINELLNFFNQKDDNFSKGLITSFSLFCIGSMTILGAIEEGMGDTPVLLYTKSIMDGFSAIILASAFGRGVLFSAFPMLIFQGGISLFVFFFMSSIPDELVDELVLHISAVGGVLIIFLGIDILGYKKLNPINMLPSLLLLLLYWLVMRN